MKGLRFLDTNEIARRLSPFDVDSAAFKAGRIFLQKVKGKISQGRSLSLESTLSGNDIEDFGHAEHDWLKQHIELANGIPSHDTLNRIYQLLAPWTFQECLRLTLNQQCKSVAVPQRLVGTAFLPRSTSPLWACPTFPGSDKPPG